MRSAFPPIGAAALRAMAVALLLVAVVHTSVGMSAMLASDDSRTFLVAPRVAAAGGSPYDAAQMHDAFAAWTGRARVVFPFMYPPPFVLMTSWVCLIGDFEVARLVWFAVNVGVTVALAWRLARWAGLPGWLTLAGAVLVTSTRDNWYWGNVNVAVALALLEAVMQASGWWLAVGAMAKIAPVVVLASFVVRRDGRALLEFAVATGALLAATALVFSPTLYVAFVRDALTPMLNGLYTAPMPRLDDPDNASLSNLLSLLGPGATPQTLSPTGGALHRIAVVGMTLALAWESRREGRGQLGSLRIAGGYGAVMILAAPVAWNTHLVLALPALAQAWRVLAPERGRRRAWAFGALFLPFVVPSAWLRESYYLLPPVGAVRAVAVLALYALCLRGRIAPSAGVGSGVQGAGLSPTMSQPPAVSSAS